MVTLSTEFLLRFFFCVSSEIGRGKNLCGETSERQTASFFPMTAKGDMSVTLSKVAMRELHLSESLL